MTDTVLASRPSAGGDVLANARDYFALLKPRVMTLVVFTGFAGLYVAPVNLDPWAAVVAVLCIAVGAGAAGAINMWYDRDIDAVMERTRARPIPAGRINATHGLWFGVVLALASVVLMATAINLVAAGLLAGAIAFYVVIYTVWLKRRTPQNIVIGGAAGAFPPLIGWAAATGEVGWAGVLLFAIIFFWTPPHFWALALYRSDDYHRAGVPMLPVVHGARTTKFQMLAYAALLVPLVLAPALIGLTGPFYAVAALAMSALFLVSAWRVWRENNDGRSFRAARQMFGFSILFLFMIFALLIIDAGTPMGVA